MPFVIARITTTDFDAWHAMHIANAARFRKDSGTISEVFYRDRDDPKVVISVQEVGSLVQWQTFYGSAKFWEIAASAPMEHPVLVSFADEGEELGLSGENA